MSILELEMRQSELLSRHRLHRAYKKYFILHSVDTVLMFAEANLPACSPHHSFKGFNDERQAGKQ